MTRLREALAIRDSQCFVATFVSVFSAYVSICQIRRKHTALKRQHGPNRVFSAQFPTNAKFLYTDLILSSPIGLSGSTRPIFLDSNTTAMHWIFLALLTASFYALYNVFIKIASGHINGLVGAVILQIVAVLLGSVLLLGRWWKGDSLQVTTEGIKWAVLAGVFVGLAEIASFFVFSKGVPASTGIAVIIGGSVAFGGIIGYFFLKEQMNFGHLAGIALVVAGIYLLSR